MLQETFQNCQSLVTLNLFTNNDSIPQESRVRLLEIFSSMESLSNLEFFHLSGRTMGVYGEDIFALYKLLHQHLPKLKECYLSCFFCLIVNTTIPEDKNCESIQKLWDTLLSVNRLSPDSPFVYFPWKGNYVLHNWLSALRCDVNFYLL